MRYAGLILNDFSAAPGTCVTFFSQGCPHKCKGCHNPETWDFDGGKEFTQEVLNNIIAGLTANGIQRDFCIMGGEPLCNENVFLTYLVISTIREKFPDIKISIWSGYTLSQLKKAEDPKVMMCLKLADFLIDGPYVESLRDITLPMRGSSNQQIIDLKKIF